MRRAALALLCSGCSTSITALDVTVAGSFPVDQLRLYAALSYGPVDQVAPAMATPLTLPYEFTAYLPDRDDTAQVAIEASSDGDVTGSALSAPFTVTSRHEIPISVTLAPRCRGQACGGGELFCDGFEDGLGAWSSASGAPSIDTTTACDGTSALGSSGSSPSFVTETGLAMPSTVYLRAHVYVDGAGTPPPFSVLALTGQAGTLALGYDATQSAFVATYGATTELFTGPLLHERWVCLKMEARLDPEDGLLAVSVDDDELDRFDALPLAAPDAFDALEAGLIATTGAISLYVDDVALAGSPLPCD